MKKLAINTAIEMFKELDDESQVAITKLIKKLYVMSSKEEEQTVFTDPDKKGRVDFTKEEVEDSNDSVVDDEDDDDEDFDFDADDEEEVDEEVDEEESEEVEESDDEDDDEDDDEEDSSDEDEEVDEEPVRKGKKVPAKRATTKKVKSKKEEVENESEDEYLSFDSDDEDLEDDEYEDEDKPSKSKKNNKKVKSSKKASKVKAKKVKFDSEDYSTWTVENMKQIEKELKDNGINSTKALGKLKDSARTKKAVEVIKKASKVFEKYDNMKIKQLQELASKNKIKAKSKDDIAEKLFDIEMKKLGWL